MQLHRIRVQKDPHPYVASAKFFMVQNTRRNGCTLGFNMMVKVQSKYLHVQILRKLKMITQSALQIFFGCTTSHHADNCGVLKFVSQMKFNKYL